MAYNSKEREGLWLFERSRKWKDSEFKKEWSDFEIKGVKKHLQDICKEELDIDASDKFGLPYTSSSAYAMVSNTNSPFKIEKDIQLNHFALTNSGQLIAVGHDYHSREHFYYVDKP